MKKTFVIQPRQSGKTTMAIYEFLKDVDNTLFVTHDYGAAQMISRRIFGKNNHINIVSCQNFIEKMRGRRYKNIILDEYLFFKNKDDIYLFMQQYLNPENLYIFSTTDKTYSEELFEFVKKYKGGGGFYSLLDWYYHKFNKVIISDTVITQLNELYYNFLTDYDTNVIDYGFKPMCDTNAMQYVLTSEEYDREILNKYKASSYLF